MQQCNTPEEFIKVVEELHGRAEILFKGRPVIVITDDGDEWDDSGNDEEIRMEIEADPELKAMLDESEQDVASGRLYSIEQARKMLRTGEGL